MGKKREDTYEEQKKCVEKNKKTLFTSTPIAMLDCLFI